MKVLFVHSSDELYGSDVSLLELVRRLPERGVEPTAVLPTDLPYRGELRRALSESGIPYVRLDMGVLRRRYMNPRGIFSFGYRLTKGVVALSKMIKTGRFDLVHSNTGAVWGGSIAASLTGVPHVWHIREIVENPAALSHFMAWQVVTFSSRIIAISTAVADHIAELHPRGADKISVIPNAVDTERFSPSVDGAAVRREWQVTPDEMLVGVAGRVHPWKGQDVLIEAMPLVLRRAPKVRFAIVGDVTPDRLALRESLVRRAEELGVADRLIWAGYRRDVPQVMAALDVLVVPSTSPEPFGRTILEAMASGTPVIATAHGGPLDIIEDGKTGLLVPPRDPAALAVAIIQMAEEPEWRKRMGEAGLAEVMEKYTVEKYVERVLRVYEEVLQEAG